MIRPLLILTVVTLAVFWPVLGHDFIGIDDDVMIVRNPNLNPPTIQSAAGYWFKPARALYMPLTYTLWAGTALMAPGRPLAFHLLSLVLHIVAVWAVFALLRELLDATWPAVMGALLFALHPLQVETVAWAAEGKDLLAGMLSVVALWQYMRYVKTARRLNYALATGAFVLAIFAKPSAVAVPLLAAFLPLQEGKGERSGLAVWWVLAAPFVLVASLAQHGNFEPIMGTLRVIPIWARPVIAADGVSFYLWKLIAPIKLGIDYGRSPWEVMGWRWLWITAAIPVILAAVLWWQRKRLPGMAAGFFLMVAGLLPVLGLVPFDFQEKSTVADHYMYLAMIGPALAGAWCLARWWDRRAIVVIALLILAAAGTRSWFATSNWRDGMTCYRHGLAVNPRSWWLADIVGYELLQAGKPAQAAEYCRRAVEIAPRYAAARAHLGTALAETGQFADAVKELETSLEISPKEPRVHVVLGDVHMLRSQFTKAALQYERAMKIDPNIPGVRERLEKARSSENP